MMSSLRNEIAYELSVNSVNKSCGFDRAEDRHANVRVKAPIMRYSDSRKSVRNAGANAISKPANESITKRLAPIFCTASMISRTVSSTDKSSGRM